MPPLNRPIPTEVDVPFQVDASGGIEATTDPLALMNHHLLSVVGTNPGERVMRPDYGVPVSHVIFEPGDQLSTNELRTQITAAVRRWEPRVSLVEVAVVATPARSGGQLIYDIRYQLQGSGEQHSAIISLGGSVEETTTVVG